VDLQGLTGVGGGFEVRAHSLEIYGTCSECK
jgi:Fe2+ or Zn2+ uptake regulation protein